MPLEPGLLLALPFDLYPSRSGWGRFLSLLMSRPLPHSESGNMESVSCYFVTFCFPVVVAVVDINDLFLSPILSDQNNI